MSATRNLLRQACARIDSSESDTHAAFGEVMRGEVEDALLAATLAALAAKGETAEEIAGAAIALRETMIRVPTSRAPLIDTCGTGGSGLGRRNISTAVAIAVAACGVAVAKHGNRAISGRSGSADVLEAVGVNIEASPEVVGRCIDQIGVGFLFARTLHPAMGRAAAVRRTLGVPTVFNLLGPLTNPAGVRRQVVGVFVESRCRQLAEVLGRLGTERAFVVHGTPAVDDLSTEGETLVWEWRDGTLLRHVLRPEMAGLPAVPLSHTSGGDPASNALALRRVLEGESGAYRFAVQYAGALALLVAGDQPLDQLQNHAASIGRALDDGSAARVLSELGTMTHA